MNNNNNTNDNHNHNNNFPIEINLVYILKTPMNQDVPERSTNIAYRTRIWAGAMAN